MHGNGCRTRGFFFALIQKRQPRTLNFRFQLSIFAAADAHDTQPGRGDGLLEKFPVNRSLKTADVDNNRGVLQKGGSLGDFVF